MGEHGGRVVVCQQYDDLQEENGASCQLMSFWVWLNSNKGSKSDQDEPFVIAKQGEMYSPEMIY